MKLHFIIDKKYDLSFIKSKKQLQLLELKYSKLKKFLEYSKIEYQKAWNKINDEFSNYVERQTGYKWFYKKYFCVISVVHPGISNWGKAPIIVRWWYENPYTQRRITAHELILSHYFEIYKRNFAKYKLTNGQIWALAEIAAFALTSLSPEVKNFWPWDNSGYYTNHNYPQIVKLQLQLKDDFLQRENFNEYIKNGIKLVKGNKKIGPS